MIQDKKTDAPKKPARKKEMIFRGKSGYGDSTILEKFLFSWMRPFISRAQKIEKEKSEENILIEELGEPAEDDKFDAEVSTFAANYELFKNLRYSIFSFDLNFQNDALFFASVWTFKHNLIISALINMFVSFVYYSSYSQGIHLAMTEYLRSKPADGESGLIFAAYQIVIMILINDTLSFIMWTHSYAYDNSYTRKASVVASVLVYEKLNKVSFAASRKELSESELIKLTGSDAGSVVSVLNQINSVVDKVCTAVGISYFFINNFGWSFAVLLSLIALFKYFKKQIDDQNRSIQEEMDKEKKVEQDLKLEFLTQIKMLKLYGWEQKFQNRIKESRLKNQALEKKILSWSNFIEQGISLVEQMIPVVTFSVFVAMGNTLEITVVMQAQSYFHQAQWLIGSIPDMWNDYKEIKKSLDRIQKFLTLSNVQQGLMSKTIDKDIALSVQGNFSWGLSKRGEDDSDEKKSIQDFIDLKNIDFKVKKGQFICVIGDVGCGKTSLLRAILREMIYVDRKHIDASGEKEQEQNYFDELQKTITGEEIKEAPIKQLGTLSYVEQKAWIQNNSIKDIILFNQPYDEQHYKETIKTCQLTKDFQDLPAGDLTEIGENGINLSGGQRARISLARAVYANKDIMLMDDPISALDAEVRKQIFLEVFKGIAKDKTRVLATNAVDFLHLSDAIVIMQKGRISAFGTFEELQSNENFKKIIDIHHQQHNLGLIKKNQTLIALKRAILKKYDDEKLQFEKSFINFRQQVSKALQKKLQVLHENNPTTITPDIKKQKTIADIQKDESIMQNSIISKPSLQQLAGQNQVEDGPEETGIKTSDDENKGQLVQKIDEVKEKEADWSNLRPMIKYTGGYLVIVIKIVVVIVQQIINRQNNRQGQDWAFQSPEEQRQNFWKNIFTVFALQASVTLMEVLMTLWNFRIGVKVKNNLYEIIMDRLAKAPINLYYDINPVARIQEKFGVLERVTSYGIVNQLTSVFREITSIGTTFYLVFYAQPSILILVAMFTYRAIYQQDIKEAYKQIHRLSDCVSEPLKTLEMSSISGVSIIRAFQQEKEFARKFKSLYEKQNMISRMQSSLWICEYMKNRPFNSFKKACILLGCMSARGTGDVVSLIRLSSSLQYLDDQIKRVTECQKNFENSLKQFQKVLEFMNIDQERQEGSLNVEDSWPEKGEIVFQNVNLRYRPETDLKLKNLSFKIEGGMKVGVVGRSASGKSTTALALPRLIELDEGSSIEIDGKDISKISLQKLRQKVTFILQEPALFKGSLRFNLDPLDNYKDEAILQVIHDSGLQDILHKQSKDQNWLKYEIEPKGGNLSEGEKQLICICRAILRKTKIIIMDEATANIDVITEQNQMKMMKKAFADSTVMTIAHRLNTIIESDLILMLQSGELLEQGNPQVLNSNQDSHFWKLCQDLEKV